MKLFFFALVVLFIIGCGGTEERVSITHEDDRITYAGRVDQSQGVNLYWPGSSVKIDFEGDSLFAFLKDQRGTNYYNIIIDNDSVRLLYLNDSKAKYLLAANLSKGSHTVELFKNTEWDRGKTEFYGFEVTGVNPILSKSGKKKRKMEFYGNSITAGYAVDDLSGMDSPDSIYTNHYMSYASLIARHFDAEYHSICKSGIGIMVSWFPLIMPEMYDRLNPEDDNSPWNFSTYSPEVVVINLFQNDSWIVEKPDYPEFIARFGKTKPSEAEIVTAYQAFLSSIRTEYPEANIICLLGNMDITQEGSSWPSYMVQAVGRLRDEKIYTHIVPYKNSKGHPNRAEQQLLANSIIQFINKTIAW